MADGAINHNEHDLTSKPNSTNTLAAGTNQDGVVHEQQHSHVELVSPTNLQSDINQHADTHEQADSHIESTSPNSLLADSNHNGATTGQVANTFMNREGEEWAKNVVAAIESSVNTPNAIKRLLEHLHKMPFDPSNTHRSYYGDQYPASDSSVVHSGGAIRKQEPSKLVIPQQGQAHPASFNDPFPQSTLNDGIPGSSKSNLNQPATSILTHFSSHHGPLVKSPEGLIRNQECKLIPGFLASDKDCPRAACSYSSSPGGKVLQQPLTSATGQGQRADTRGNPVTFYPSLLGLDDNKLVYYAKDTASQGPYNLGQHRATLSEGNIDPALLQLDKQSTSQSQLPHVSSANPPFLYARSAPHMAALRNSWQAQESKNSGNVDRGSFDSPSTNTSIQRPLINDMRANLSQEDTQRRESSDSLNRSAFSPVPDGIFSVNHGLPHYNEQQNQGSLQGQPSNPFDDGSSRGHLFNHHGFRNNETQMREGLPNTKLEEENKRKRKDSPDSKPNKAGKKESEYTTFYRCPGCDKIFDSRIRITSHLNKHQPKGQKSQIVPALEPLTSDLGKSVLGSYREWSAETQLLFLNRESLRLSKPELEAWQPWAASFLDPARYPDCSAEKIRKYTKTKRNTEARYLNPPRKEGKSLWEIAKGYGGKNTAQPYGKDLSHSNTPNKAQSGAEGQVDMAGQFSRESPQGNQFANTGYDVPQGGVQMTIPYGGNGYKGSGISMAGGQNSSQLNYGRQASFTEGNFADQRVIQNVIQNVVQKQQHHTNQQQQQQPLQQHSGLPLQNTYQQQNQGRRDHPVTIYPSLLTDYNSTPSSSTPPLLQMNHSRSLAPNPQVQAQQGKVVAISNQQSGLAGIPGQVRAAASRHLPGNYRVCCRDHQGKEARELSYKKDEILYITDYNPCPNIPLGPWWLAVNRNGIPGLVWSPYLRKVEVTGETTQREQMLGYERKTQPQQNTQQTSRLPQRVWPQQMAQPGETDQPNQLTQPEQAGMERKEQAPRWGGPLGTNRPVNWQPSNVAPPIPTPSNALVPATQSTVTSGQADPPVQSYYFSLLDHPSRSEVELALKKDEHIHIISKVNLDDPPGKVVTYWWGENNAREQGWVAIAMLRELVGNITYYLSPIGEHIPAPMYQQGSK